jgi:probable HAF family extracellular repeat protein
VDRRGLRGAQAADINEAGQIVGASWSSSASAYRAVLWEGDTITDLSAPAPDETSAAWAINEAGQAVGLRDDDAVMWIDGDLVELPIPDRA